MESLSDPDPVVSLRARLDNISQSIATARPQGAEQIRLNRILDNAETLLHLPRSTDGFEESLIASGLAEELSFSTSDSQDDDDDDNGRHARIEDAASASSVGTQQDSAAESNSRFHIAHESANAREYAASVALEEVLAQLNHVTAEMERRAEESSHLGELVTAWRGEIVRELQSLQAEYQEALEQTLAELRYLRHKVDYLEERTAATDLSASVASSPRRSFREPVVAGLVETLGSPPRFSSLSSSYHSDSGSPRTLRRQIERARQEAEMINHAIGERKDLVEQRVKSLE